MVGTSLDRPSATHVRRLNGVLRDGLHFHQLRPGDDGSRFTVGQVGDELAQARAAIAGSLAHYIADHDIGRLRICANDALLVALRRSLSGGPAPVVRHAHLWQPREGGPPPGTEEDGDLVAVRCPWLALPPFPSPDESGV